MINENKFYRNYYVFLFIFSIIINLLFLYNIILFNNVENIIRIIILCISICLTIFFNTILYITHNKKIFTSLSIIFFIYIIILIIINYNLNSIYNRINKITKTKDIYSSSIITLKDNKNDDIFKIDRIGIINDKFSIDGYIIPHNIINDNKLDLELIEYDNYIGMINDLMNKKIDYIFLPTNYKIKFDNIEFNDSIDNLKIIYTQDKEKEENINNKELNKPFTMLLMGVDSTLNNINTSTYNGDALIIITFNPKNNSATMLSIPRDTYLNISCMNNRRNKITHSAWSNDNCTIDTLNNTFNINIDYYVKINFKGLVNLVDDLGGIDVNVPYSFCESNSNRLWGDNTVYVKEGMQHLTGEQALALARNRHPWPEHCPIEYTNYYSSDIIRGENQQLVLNEIIEKLKNIKSIDTINKLLNTINDNALTNLSTNNILSLYNIRKNIKYLNIQKLNLNGYDEYIYDYDYINNTGTKLTLYNYIPYKESIDELSKIMNDNINGNLIDFNNTIKDINGKKYIKIMPNFIDKTYDEVVDFCTNNNIELKINYVSGNKINHITKQSIQELTDLEYVKSLTIDVVNDNVIPKKDNSKNNDIDYNINKQKDNNKSKINQNNNTNNTNIDESKNDNSKEIDPIINEFLN